MDLAGGAIDGDSHELHEFMRATHNSPKEGFYQYFEQGHCYLNNEMTPNCDRCLGADEMKFIPWVGLFKHGIANFQWHHSYVNFYVY